MDVSHEGPYGNNKFGSRKQLNDWLIYQIFSSTPLNYQYMCNSSHSDPFPSTLPAKSNVCMSRRDKGIEKQNIGNAMVLLVPSEGIASGMRESMYATEDSHSSSSSSKLEFAHIEFEHVGRLGEPEFQVGMSIMNQKMEGESTSKKEVYSLSSSSDQDSDRELEMIAEEIRADLRMQQLMEIAVVAERAAEAGHDSFTGLASTFGVDDGKPMKPLQMKRNHTYTEGQNSHRPILGLGRTHTMRRAKRKVPVMALRHIDDLIPPMRQLHLHLRCHLFQMGVDTENSLNGTSNHQSLGNMDIGESTRSQFPSYESNFIQRMTQWVAKSSLKADFLEEKKSAGLTDNELKVTSCDDDCNYHVGDRLCAHITTAEVASGHWRPSPVLFPPELLPPDEDDFENKDATPSRRVSFPGDADFSITDKSEFPSAENLQNILISSKLNPLSSRLSNSVDSDPLCGRRRIVPVALFDNFEDEEAEDVSERSRLEFRDIPNPFEITVKSDQPSTPIASGHASGWTSLVVTPECNVPNLFVTPARLKGIRDAKSLLMHNRSSVWAPSRRDSFQSDSMLAPITFEDLGAGYERAISKSNGYHTLDNVDSSRTFLQPRGEIVNEMLDDIKKSRDATQSAGEATFDMGNWSAHGRLQLQQQTVGSDDSSHMKSLQIFHGPSVCTLENAATLDLVGLSRLSQENERPIPSKCRIEGSCETTLENRADGMLLEPCDLTPTVSLGHSTSEDVKEVERETQVSIGNDSVHTPLLSNCRSCEFLVLTNAPSSDVEAIRKEKDESKDRDERMAPELSKQVGTTIGLRRVTSCPSLSEMSMPSAVVSSKQIKTSEKAASDRLIMRVFERLSPKSSLSSRDRSILLSSQENHDYLNNYLYVNKPSHQIDRGIDPPIRPFCADPCGLKCGDTAGGCSALSSAADAATFFLQPWSPKQEDELLRFETKSSKDYSEFHNHDDTWFDSATEKFGGAIERLVGNSLSRNVRRRSHFEAPTLHKKTPQSARKVRQDVIEINDPRRVKGIILLPQTRVQDSKGLSGTRPDDAFKSLYGISRDEFRGLSTEERFALWEERQAKVWPRESQSGDAGDSFVQNWRGKRQHRPAFSSSDISLTP